MARKRQLLCGTAVKGEIFRFGCGLSFTSSQFTISAYPCFTFSSASSRRQVAASFDFVEICGPRRIAASRYSRVQGSPQSTGHPSVAYLNSMPNTGWCSILGSGRIWSRNSGWYLLCYGVVCSVLFSDFSSRLTPLFSVFSFSLLFSFLFSFFCCLSDFSIF